MTVFLPLDPSTPLPPQPSFLTPSINPATHLDKAVRAIMKARRIVVICGAGISVQAGIPDFRSSDGLFQTIKRDNPREAMSSGKELFDVSVFNSEQKTSLFCQMIAQLSDLSHTAEPTSFHQVLRALDDRGKLLRVYTQNIDAIEQKSGLSFGVPEYEGRRSKSRSKNKSKVPDDNDNATDDAQRVASTSRLPSPPVEMPRCIPLHGTLQAMHCQICNHSYPLLDYMPALVAGQPPHCPECISLEETRQLVGKRPRGIGKLRPSVVLYNEEHKDGEGVGNVVQKDLIGSSKGKGRSGADLLLVVGTSLKVPGTKRMVREFAKAVRARSATSKEESSSPGGRSSSSGLATPSSSPRRSPVSDEDNMTSPKAFYLNLDFPVPTREWEGVFDAWIQGDAQQFANILHAEIEKETKAKELASEKKRRKDEEAAQLNAMDDELPDLGRMREQDIMDNMAGPSIPISTPKRKAVTETPQRIASKKKKTAAYFPPSPPTTPMPPPKRMASQGSHRRDRGGDVQMVEPPPPPPPPKLMLRIPARPRCTPEVYITTSPQYVRPYELVTVLTRTRSLTPPTVNDDDTIADRYAHANSASHLRHQLRRDSEPGDMDVMNGAYESQLGNCDPSPIQRYSRTTSRQRKLVLGGIR